MTQDITLMLVPLGKSNGVPVGKPKTFDLATTFGEKSLREQLKRELHLHRYQEADAYVLNGKKVDDYTTRYAVQYYKKSSDESNQSRGEWTPLPPFRS